jgi:SAM-dependent methyltransferase
MMMISKWIIKAITQKIISYLPGSEKINCFFQKHVTGGVRLTDEYFGLKLQHASDHYLAFQRYGQSEAGKIILELGTGWYPVIPLFFYLAGSGRVISIDIQRWMTRDTQQLTLLKMLEWHRRGLLNDLLPGSGRERLERLADIVSDPDAFDTGRVNEMIGLTPLITDAANLDLPDESVDFICSNNTLEHIPAGKLRDILKEFNRVLKPGGIMSHFIDMSDHFAHFDHAITIYNFLKFSERQWRILDNRIQPQNRLRFRDYQQIYEETGLPVTETIVREGAPEELERIRVHVCFSRYSTQELAISHATIISQKQVTQNVI